MLISEQKPFEEILDYVTKDRVIFLIGCKGCADGCESGGERQVLEIKKRLEEEGKAISGFSLIDMVCNEALTRMKLAAYAEAIESADSVLVMTCGAGIQTVASSTHKVIHPGCNTISSGHAEWKQAERCMECGDCVLEFTGGICPIARCAKGLLNGPCGGSQGGKCEISPNLPCAWQLIIERHSKIGSLHMLEEIILPKNWDPSLKDGSPTQRG
ncbi:MAG: 5,10-methylenetetrahydrofolate reductase [Nitrospira sp.]|nr:5,10-methylenetetrahydrofolate reductase [Nitrospira sp.]